MYGRGGPNPDDQDFNNSIKEFDRDRNYFYSSKIEASEDLDNMYENQHSETCEYKKIKPHEKGSSNCEPKKEDSIKCMKLNVNNRKYYSLSWEEIAEAAEQDEFLVDLKHTLQTNNHEKLTELLRGKVIHCPDNTNGISAIIIEDLSIYQDVIIVQDRIWAPQAITFAFFNNLHLATEE